MSALLDIVIALFFTYLLLSLFTTAMNEVVAGLTKLRASTLKEGISLLLDDKQGTPSEDVHTTKLFGQSLIQGIKTGGTNPSYIDSRTFTNALLAILPPPRKPPTTAATTPAAAIPAAAASTPAADTSATSNNGNAAPVAPGSAPATLADLIARINELQEGSRLKQSLLSIVNDSTMSLEKAKTEIAGWYDRSMDRVSGLYKRKSQVISVIVGGVLAILLNADTIGMVKVLASDSAMRAGLAVAAQRTVTGDKPDGQFDRATLQKGLSDLQAAQGQISNALLPIGWNMTAFWSPQNFQMLPSHEPNTNTEYEATTKFWSIVVKLFGLLLTGLALTLGAPFWFDLLGTFVNIRSAGPVPK